MEKLGNSISGMLQHEGAPLVRLLPNSKYLAAGVCFEPSFVNPREFTFFADFVFFSGPFANGFYVVFSSCFNIFFK